MLNAPVRQIAYFVSDARAAAEAMHERFGAGPFFFAERIELARAEHRGQPGDFLHSSAYGQWGEVMVEFVQQDREGPSPFRDLYGPGEEGLHHVANIVPDFDAALEHWAGLGFDLAARAETKSGVEFAFVDTTAALGHMIELYAAQPAITGFYAMVADAAARWDGRELIRTL